VATCAGGCARESGSRAVTPAPTPRAPRRLWRCRWRRRRWW
jgi:hypothetical protein